MMLQPPKLKIQHPLTTLLIPLSLAVIVRGLLLTRWCGDFNSDEAIVGLMAKHILEGHFPVFFYGQFYMGSLEAMVAAVIFWLFGDMNGLLLRLSPIIFYLAFIIVAFLWLDSWYNRLTALWGALFLAIPPVLLMIYTYVASAGNLELLFLGTLLLFLFHRGLKSGWNSKRVFSLGLVAGLAVWTHLLAMLYLIPILVIWLLSSNWWPRWRTFLLNLSLIAWLVIGLSLLGAVIIALFVLKLAVDVLYIQRLIIATIFIIWVASLTFWRWRNRLASPENQAHQAEWYTFWLGLGGILGMAPMIYYFFNPGNSTGGQDNFTVVTWQRLPELWRLHVYEIYPALIGLHTYRPDSPSLPLLLAKIGVAAIFVGVILFFGRRYRQALVDLVLLRPLAPQPEHYLWLLGSLTLVFGLVNGNNYVVEHIRYYLPLLFVLSALVGMALAHWQKSRPALAIILAIFLLGYYGLTNFRYYQALPATCSAQQVADLLISKQIKGGMAYYEHAYKLTFLSHEKVIIAPYRSRDRYEAYTHYVSSLPQRTYIFQAGVETEAFLSELASPTDFIVETLHDFNIFTATNPP